MIDYSKPIQYADGSAPNTVETSGPNFAQASPGTVAVVDGNYYRADGTHLFDHQQSVVQAAPAFDPAKPAATRDGRPARILATDAAGERPLVVLIKREDGTEREARRYADGRYHAERDMSIDLVNVDPTKTLYVSLGNAFNVDSQRNDAQCLDAARDDDPYSFGVLKLRTRGKELVSAELVAQ